VQGVFFAMLAVFVELEFSAHVLLIDEGNVVAVLALAASQTDFGRHCSCHYARLLSLVF
jgi:hypothetical protein